MANNVELRQVAAQPLAGFVDRPSRRSWPESPPTRVARYGHLCARLESRGTAATSQCTWMT